RRRHTRFSRDWSSDVCSSDLLFAISVLRGWRIDAVHHPFAAPLAGLASGTLSTSTGMSGPPVVLLFTTRQYDMQQFRGSITAYRSEESRVGRKESTRIGHCD